MTIDQDRWKAGYDAARRFYGTEARASLRAITRAVRRRFAAGKKQRAACQQTQRAA